MGDMAETQKKYLRWGMAVVVLVGFISLCMLELTAPVIGGDPHYGHIYDCLQGIGNSPLPATQTVVASYTPIPICATQAALETAEAVPWWQFWSHPIATVTP